MGKLSAGADRGIGALVAEAIAGMLAADLDLPCRSHSLFDSIRTSYPQSPIPLFATWRGEAVPWPSARGVFRRDIRPGRSENRFPRMH